MLRSFFDSKEQGSEASRGKRMTVEEFEDWAAATDRHEAVAGAADEEGGPSLSLVPTTSRHCSTRSRIASRNSSHGEWERPRRRERPADRSARRSLIDVTGQLSRDGPVASTLMASGNIQTFRDPGIPGTHYLGIPGTHYLLHRPFLFVRPRPRHPRLRANPQRCRFTSTVLCRIR